MLKRFLEWIKLKEKLHNIVSEPPLAKERDLWCVSIGENVGVRNEWQKSTFFQAGYNLKEIVSWIFSGCTNNINPS